MHERADLEGGPHQHVIAEMLQAEAAAKRLGVECVTRTPSGAWREAARWAGSQASTAHAAREIRLRQAERSLRATGLDADRRRRLRFAELTLDPDTRRRLRLAVLEGENGWR